MKIQFELGMSDIKRIVLAHIRETTPNIEIRECDIKFLMEEKKKPNEIYTNRWTEHCDFKVTVEKNVFN